ncbi:MAG: hypothetical protein EOM14_04905 [Clostridia bacterium]|nr:hypothetical protein [Clostridia bacterium]
MENKNNDFGTSSGDLSVDAILAEYEYETGGVLPAKDKIAAEVSEPVTPEIQDGGSIAAAQIKSENFRVGKVYDEPTQDIYPSHVQSLSEVLSSAHSASPAKTSFFAETEPGMSVDEIMLMADVYKNGGSVPVSDTDELISHTDSNYSKNSGSLPTSSDFPAQYEEEAPTLEPKHAKNKSVLPVKSFLSGLLNKAALREVHHEEEENEQIPTLPVTDGDMPVSSNIKSDARSASMEEFSGDEVSAFAENAPPENPDEAPEPALRQIYAENAGSGAEENPFAAASDASPASFETTSKQSSESERSASAESEGTASAEISDTEKSAGYAKADNYDEYFEDELEALHDERTDPKPDLRERLLAPIVAIMAYSAAQREKHRAEADDRRYTPKKELPPELSPAKAAMLYAQQSQSLRLRCVFATILTAVLVYLSYGLPAAGLLGSSPTILALVCLILMLTVMIIGLDIFTNGIATLMSGISGAESLISVSAIVAMFDAVYIAVTGDTQIGPPFCGVAALSMTFALWGTKINCDNYAVSFYTAAKAEDPSVVLSEAGVDDDGCALTKSKRAVTGFVRTAETADVFENAYRLFSPILIISCIVLSAFCFVASKDCTNFIHTLGASLCICASFSAFFGFSFPLSISVKRLARSGVAIAGYSGCAELGRVRRVIITDSDLFPARTVSVADISIAENVSPQKVISYTGSMISAAGMCTAPAFVQLMRKNGCVMQKVEDFACHEGGGIIARINGDQVYVGTASFMRLMGVRLPSDTAARACVYTAINDCLAGFFSLNYTAVASVQRALVMLLSGAGDPVFAIRDFNITPLLIKQKFRLPSGIYDFPSFADRYRMSAPEAEENATVAAMYSRGGLGAAAGLVKRGRRLYIALRICSALSILGSIIGMILMLTLCWSGAYGSASCGNIITYMLLWLVPVFVISYGLRN